MCKLLLTVGEFRKRQAEAIISAANRIFAQSQRNGFGFIAGNDKGEYCVQRFLRPDSFMLREPIPLPQWFTGEKNGGGKIPNQVTYILCHGRTSTNRVSLENVHPFENKGRFFAHNGILDWSGTGERPEAKDGCDSESYFAWIMAGNDIENSHAAWKGYGACALVDSRNGHVDLWKDDNANLGGAPIKGGGWLWTTEKVDVAPILKAAQLKAACKVLSLGSLRLTCSGKSEPVSGKFAGFGSRLWDYQSTRSIGEKAEPRTWGKAATKDVVPAYAKPNPLVKEQEIFPDWEPDRDKCGKGLLNYD